MVDIMSKAKIEGCLRGLSPLKPTTAPAKVRQYCIKTDKIKYNVPNGVSTGLGELEPPMYPVVDARFCETLGKKKF